MKILKSKNKPSPQEGNNGDLFIQYKGESLMVFYLKQMGVWREHFEILLPQGPKGKDGLDGKDGKDGSDANLFLSDSSTISLKGDGTMKKPYTFHQNYFADEIDSFELSECKSKITLITKKGKKYIVSLQDIYDEVFELKQQVNYLNKKDNIYYLSENLIPLSVPLTTRGGGRSGISTGNYIVVPHSSYLQEITWRFLAAGPKQYTPKSIFMPHEEMGGKRPLITIDVYCEESLIAENLIPRQPIRLKNPQYIPGGSFIYFDAKIAEGTPYGMSVTLGLKSDIEKNLNKEFINI